MEGAPMVSVIFKSLLARDAINTWRLSLGIWLVVSGAYLLTSSGRLDMIDAQWKFAVTSALVKFGEFRTDDPILGPSQSMPYYPLGATLAGTPLAAIGFRVAPSSPELAQFLWSMTTPLIAALIPATMFAFWRNRGVSTVAAFGWALVFAFGTLLWPTATSSFDQAQHAWLLLLSVLTINRAIEKESRLLAAIAGGLFSLVLHYQPTYAVLLIPICAAIYPWSATTFRDRKWILYAAFFSLGTMPGLLAELWFNYWRFGSPFVFVPPSGAPTLGNPLVGLGVLLFSQGKGIIFFTPLVLVAVVGFARMRREHPRIARLIAAVAAVHLLLVSSLAFPGGDWCWGPRYLVVTLPLLGLLLPYGAKAFPRVPLGALAAISIAVQLLALSIDHHRFYYERNLAPYFWAEDPLFHFRESQLIARPGELLDPSNPKTFPRFSSGHAEYLTYSPFGPPAHLLPESSTWVRHFAVYYFPRPWPLWLRHIRNDRRFIQLETAVPLLVCMMMLGLVIAIPAIKKAENTRRVGGESNG